METEGLHSMETLWRQSVCIETMETQRLRTHRDRGSALYGDTLIETNPPPPGVFHIYYVPSSKTVCKRTPIEGFVPGSSRGVLLHTVLDEGT